MSRTAKMLVTIGGARIGTIGGGCLEADITEQAIEVAQRGECLLATHTLNNQLAGDYGLTCGGTVTVLLEPIVGNVDVWDAIVDTLAHGERGILVTATKGQPRKLLLTFDGQEVGDTSLRAHAAGFDSTREEAQLDDDVLIEVIAPAPHLIVIGCGHVGAAIGEAATFAGWRVTMVDDRPDFADAARLPFAERVVVCDFLDVAATLAPNSDAWVVIATRGHQHDALVADQFARRPLRYLGMLGSKRKVALTWKLLRTWGVDDEALARVHAPVGLRIGADDPREIAISVVAEMIAVRRSQHNGLHQWPDFPTSTSSAR